MKLPPDHTYAPRYGPDDVFTADLLQDRPITPRVFNVPGMIPARTVTTIDGDGGAGKSTLALQLAVATVLGEKWLGLDVLPGRALYLSAEDDVDELHRRLNDMTLYYGANLSDLGGLKIIPCSEASALLMTLNGHELASTPLVDTLGDLIFAWGPALVVLDSRADIFGGNENDRGQVRQFVGLLRSMSAICDAAIVMLAHPSLAGLNSGSGSSGSTAWSNSVRSRLYLSQPGQEGTDPGLRLLSVKKANYAAGGVEMRIRRESGVFVAEDGSSGTSALDRIATHNRLDDLFLRLLGTYNGQGRRVSDATGAAYAPALFARDPLSNGAARPALAAAMNRLFAKNLIAVETVGPPSKQRRQLVTVQTEAAG